MYGRTYFDEVRGGFSSGPVDVKDSQMDPVGELRNCKSRLSPFLEQDHFFAVKQTRTNSLTSQLKIYFWILCEAKNVTVLHCCFCIFLVVEVLQSSMSKFKKLFFVVDG